MGEIDTPVWPNGDDDSTESWYTHGGYCQQQMIFFIGTKQVIHPHKKLIIILLDLRCQGHAIIKCLKLVALSGSNQRIAPKWSSCKVVPECMTSLQLAICSREPEGGSTRCCGYKYDVKSKPPFAADTRNSL